MKRTWITVKRGILEPKHRFALGELIWLFIYILDLANWEEGAILEWNDKSAAEEMEMPVATLRDQRRKLEDRGYVTAERKQHGIRLVIHNWTNPREYTGKKYNVKVPSDTPSDTPSYTPSYTAPDEKCVPSLESKDKDQKSKEPGNFAKFNDKFQEKTRLTNYTPMVAIKAFEEITKAGATIEDMVLAIDQMIEKKYVLVSPASIVNPTINCMNYRLRNTDKVKDDIAKAPPEIVPLEECLRLEKLNEERYNNA